MLEGLYKIERYFMQMTHSGVVVLDGDRATARFVVREHGRGEGTYYENLAVYNDELIRQADGWRFATRSYTYRFLDRKSFDDEAFEVVVGMRTRHLDEQLDFRATFRVRVLGR